MSSAQKESEPMMDLILMELTSFLLLLLPLFLFVFSYGNRSKNPTSSGRRLFPLLGGLLDFLRNKHRFLDWITDIVLQNPTHTMSFSSIFKVSGVITANPANVEHILKNNFENYPKGERSISMLEDFLGHGIFNSDGEQWKSQRKAASFEFNKRSLRNFVVDAVQLEIGSRLLPLLNRAAKEDTIIDLQDVLERFGFDNVCKVAFGEDPACLANEGKTTASDFTKAFGDAQTIISGRFLTALEFTWRINKFFNIGSEKQLKESVSVVHNYAMEIIRSRVDQRDDLLSRFASDEANTEEFLRDIVINFILAGRETTSSALTWFFWILSSRPDVEKKILEEVTMVRARNQNCSETFSFDELREMHYLHSAISESLRLYPPVALDTQSCRKDDILPDGTFVGKGWFVTYSAYAMGRLEDVWGKDCKEYKPERWLENGEFRPESPFKFPVFHAGPRMCLGKEMAYIQMKSVVACVLERFEIVVVEDKDPEKLLVFLARDSDLSSLPDVTT